MNDTNETPRVRQVVVERVTTKREDILANGGTPSEAFEAAKNGGVVLTESETEEYIIKDYPEDPERGRKNIIADSATLFLRNLQPHASLYLSAGISRTTNQTK